MTPADPWDRFSTRRVWCSTCGKPSPELRDHHEAIAWGESHDCQSAATSERTAA